MPVRSDVKRHASALILCSAVLLIVLIAFVYDRVWNAPPKPVQIPAVFTGDDPLIEVSGNILRININEADESVLELLPGIGSVTAEAICTYRSEHGDFSDAAALLNVSGIGEATLNAILPYLTFE